MTAVLEPLRPADDLGDHAAYAAGLREMADWVEAHRDLPTPYGVNCHTFPIRGARGQISFATVDELARVAADLGVTVLDRGGDHWSGTLTTGRVQINLVCLPPAPAPADEQDGAES